MNASHLNIFYFSIYDENVTVAKIRSLGEYSTHYMLNIEAEQKATFFTFMTLNLIVGNLFRFVVLRSVINPVEIRKPLNLMILADESIKVIR